MFPGESCWQAGNRPSFGRPADLIRHYIHVHAPAQHTGIFCDYDRCHRVKHSFPRKHHYRDHLRDLHKEDIPRHGKGPKRGRKITDTCITRKWWRCSKCLRRVDIKDQGWKCCGVECELSRQEARSPPGGLDRHLLTSVSGYIDTTLARD